MNATPIPIAILTSVLMGLAIALLARLLTWTTFSTRSYDVPTNAIEPTRQRRIAQGNKIYRWFKPVIDELQTLRLLHLAGRVSRVRNDLKAGGEPLPFTAEEFLATAAVKALVYATATAALFTMLGSLGAGIVFGGAVWVSTFVIQTSKLHRMAVQRKERFKQRLPFAVDLMALMMEAGAGFRESLGTIVNETKNHPVGEEFGQVLNDIRHGQTLRTSFEALRGRLSDSELNDFIFAVNNADELGTAPSTIFLEQAEQMRLKRSQRVEKLAGKANANITFPGLVVMLACILLVMTPFILQAISETSSTPY